MGDFARFTAFVPTEAEPTSFIHPKKASLRFMRTAGGRQPEKGTGRSPGPPRAGEGSYCLLTDSGEHPRFRSGIFS